MKVCVLSGDDSGYINWRKWKLDGTSDVTWYGGDVGGVGTVRNGTVR